MQPSLRPPRPTRACPLCASATERVARSLPDRALNLLMPVKRYRCGGAGCGWEGLLMSRQHQPAGRGPADRPLGLPTAATEAGRVRASIVFAPADAETER